MWSRYGARYRAMSVESRLQPATVAGSEMTIWGKILGGATGFAIGGPLGALVGTVLGHGMDRLADQSLPRRDQDNTRTAAFTIGVIVLGAKMAKADGRVSRDEITAFRQVFRIPPDQVGNVARIFNMAKRDSQGFEPYARQLARLFKDRPAVLEELLLCLVHIAKADGQTTQAEIRYLRDVAAIFGIETDHFEQIRAAEIGPDDNDPYEILGVSRQADNATIKQAYRTLVRTYHPDRLSAEGVAADMIKAGSQRMAAINAAYDRVAKERGLR